MAWTEFIYVGLVPLEDSCQRGIESKKWIFCLCSIELDTEVLSLILSVIWEGREIICVRTTDKCVT